MPYQRPTLTELQAQAIADITGITQDGNLLRRAILRALSWAQAGLAWLHYAYLDWISRESVPWTATEERLYAWGALRGVIPLPAATASGSASFSGVEGAPLPAGTPVRRQDGTAYVTTADGTVAGGAVTVPITATVAAAAGNADAGTPMALGAAVDGISADGVAATALTGGADIETEDAFRSRMLERYQVTPEGGAATDYVAWAKTVPGVTRAWVRPLVTGPGTVAIYTMWDLAEAAHGGFPQGSDGVASTETRDTAATGDQLLVADAIMPLRPVTALVYSMAPTPAPINVTIADLAGSTTAIQAAIRAALQDMFLRRGAPGATTWPPASPGDTNGEIWPSDISVAIASVPGVTRFTLAAPSASITAAAGALPVLGTLSFT